MKQESMDIVARLSGIKAVNKANSEARSTNPKDIVARLSGIRVNEADSVAQPIAPKAQPVVQPAQAPVAAKDPAIENWLPVPWVDPVGIKITGNIMGHPKYKDGTVVTTSVVVKFEDGYAITQSGSKYKLGKIKKQ